jgi:hypothetical protein
MPDLNELSLADLLRNPREALDIEIKGWLNLAEANDRARLAKAIIALANHGGGYLIIGLTEQAGQFYPASDAPVDLAGLSQDAVQNAVQKYVDPPIQCRTEHVVNPNNGLRFPIVVVAGGHRVPLRAKFGSPDGKLVKGRVYTRCPGPRSEEPQTFADWDQLFERCLLARKVELVAAFRDLLAGEAPRLAAREPDLRERLQGFIGSSQQRWRELTNKLPTTATPRFPHGFYEVAFAIDDGFDVLSLGDFRNLLKRSLRNHSGWPPFVIIDRPPYSPRPMDDTIETWMGPEEDGSTEVPSRCDFWRIAPEGLFYTRRGFNEDGSIEKVQPGTAFSLTTAIWRVGEAILQAYYVATALGAADGKLIGYFCWNGISGRKLMSIDDRYLSYERTAYQNHYATEANIEIPTIPTSLPEIVFTIVSPLYQLFDFFQLPKRVVQEELFKMMSHQFPQ